MNKLVMLTVLTSLLVVGCSSGESTSTTLPDGSKATVNKTGDGGGMTVQGNGTEAAIGTAAKVTEEQLHVPFYPGAQLINEKSMTVKTSTEESALAFFTSTDDIEKIADFYKEKLKGLEFSKFQDGDSVNFISKEFKDASGGKVAIALTRKGATAPVEISIGWGKS